MMEVGSFTAPLLNAFHEVIEKQSLTRLADEWNNYQLFPTVTTGKILEPTDENYSGYVASIADECERKLTISSVNQFCTSVLAVWAKERGVPESNQLIKLEQQGFVCINNLSIASHMVIDEVELRKQFILARKYVMDYTTLYDKLRREKREAEEALIRAQQNRNNMKIISDDEDNLSDHEPPIELAKPPNVTSTPRLTVINTHPKVSRKRRATERLLDIDAEFRSPPKGSRMSYKSVDSEASKLSTKAVEGRRRSKRFEVMEMAPEPTVSVKMETARSNRPDPREYAREARMRHREITLSIIRREREVKTALAHARAEAEKEAKAYASRSALARSRKPRLLPSILAEKRKQGIVISAEEELDMMCNEYKDCGIADEPTKKRMLKLFSKWRRESAPAVKTERIADFNTACNIVDSILTDDILVPNKMRKVDQQFRAARKFIMLL